MESIDNGGAQAIKGFNYQKASIIHVMIHNFFKDDFKVIPESKEDFEIHLDQEVYYIQVKGRKKISLANLKSRPKGKDSIIEKNLSPGIDTNKRKIFLWDLTETTKSELIRESGTLVSDVYAFSKDQKLEVVNALGLAQSQVARLDNQYIYITPFPNDLNLALTVLKGELVNENLLVTNERARIVLGELSLEIDQRSEILVHNVSDINKKEINGKYLQRVFSSLHQKELFDQILNNLSINSIMKDKIKRVKLRIPLLHQELKEKIKQRADLNIIMESSDENGVIYLRSLLSEMRVDIATELSYALSIDCFCELGELTNDN